MNLNPIKANMTELKLNDYLVLFSYRTPVAFVDRRTKMGYMTSKKWSRTTTRHISTWFKDMNYGEGKADTEIREMPQEFLDNLIAEVK